MTKQKYFNILDFGSSKIRFSVFDSDLNKKFSESNPIIYGEKNLDCFYNIKDLVKKAEKNILSHIQDIVLIIDNDKMLNIDISLTKELDKDTEIINVYNLLILELSHLININYNKHEIIHIILSKYIINDKSFYKLPKNKTFAKKIKAEFKIICFPKLFLNDLKLNFNKINVNLNKIFCTSYLKTLSYQKKINLTKVSFLDIGLNKTTLLIYNKNNLKYIHSIPIGGYHITKDISKVFNISLDDAEKIKQSFNETETEFSYSDSYKKSNFSLRDILSKNIKIDLLKKVILFRVQEIIDLSFQKLNNSELKNNLKEIDLFLIGGGSILFNNNSFYLADNLKFKSISFYPETDLEICNSALNYLLNNYQHTKKIKKNRGLFEKFFNIFSQ